MRSGENLPSSNRTPRGRKNRDRALENKYRVLPLTVWRIAQQHAGTQTLVPHPGADKSAPSMWEVCATWKFEEL